MAQCGEGEFYAPVPEKFLEIMAGDLGSIVGDDLFGDPEPEDKISP